MSSGRSDFINYCLRKETVAQHTRINTVNSYDISVLCDILQWCKNGVVGYVNRHRIGPNGDKADKSSYTVAKREHKCAIRISSQNLE
jgi:hypothetical protein